MNKKSQESDRSRTDSRNREVDKVPDEKRRGPAPPIASASIILISPTNQVLLLQRVGTATSFASAYDFPGGNLSTYHDGTNLPPQSTERFHQDSLEYRLAAIRETFEESGILLARDVSQHTSLSPAELEEGRRLVHANKIPFTTWLAQNGRRADVEGLLPFTRWISPTYAWKRFTTQMYVYFLPMNANIEDMLSLESWNEQEADGKNLEVAVPTTDGGLEHVNVSYRPAYVWCKLAEEGSIVLYPPQFFLLHFVAQCLDFDGGDLPTESVGHNEMEERRKRLVAFLKSDEGESDTPWADQCISPRRVKGAERTDDGREIIALDDPGHELQGTNRSGVRGYCMLFDLQKDGPRRLAVVKREEIVRQGVKL